MANYATYADVEKVEFAASGETFSAAQQTIVTANLTTAHGIIVGFLGTEPTSSAELINIEVQIAVNLRWNAKHPDEYPRTVLSSDLVNRLNNLHKIPDSTEEEICGTINMRGWPNY